MSTWTATEPEPLGSADELKARIEALYPGVVWRSFQASFFGTWDRGDDHAEFQLTPSPSGRFSSFSMKRVPREEVERVCTQLGLVAVDPGVRIFRPAGGAWEKD
jgi:hypothetical protein